MATTVLGPQLEGKKKKKKNYNYRRVERVNKCGPLAFYNLGHLLAQYLPVTQALFQIGHWEAQLSLSKL